MAAMMMNERWAAKNLLADRQIPKSIVFALHSIDIRLLLKGPICAKETHFDPSAPSPASKPQCSTFVFYIFIVKSPFMPGSASHAFCGALSLIFSNISAIC